MDGVSTASRLSQQRDLPTQLRLQQFRRNPKGVEIMRRIALAGLSAALASTGLAVPAIAADDLVFKGVAYQSDVAIDYGISLDKKAFTIGFAGLEAKIGSKGSPSVATRSYSLVVPLSGAKPDTEFPIFVSGYANIQKGANAHAIFSVNEQTVVTDFAPPMDKDFIQEIKFKPGNNSELRMTVVLIADRDAPSDGNVFINVTAIDTDALKHKK
jgi:hypothetical protein